MSCLMKNLMCNRTTVDDPQTTVNGPRSNVHSPRATGCVDRGLPAVIRGLLIVVCGLVLSITASAQYSGYEKVSDLPAFRKEFAVQSSRITTISSNFTQEKNLSALTEKITSSGTFRFKRSNKVRIEYTKPFSYTMVMNGDK